MSSLVETGIGLHHLGVTIGSACLFCQHVEWVVCGDAICHGEDWFKAGERPTTVGQRHGQASTQVLHDSLGVLS